ncbi:alpha-amylase family glycosyl hydrolase [Rubrivirga sp. S365]|uniref:alpha-amylase family glycosyl hydrolase n=1 Tax=Rubrivirga sp. S365 TaxID=3076080 RepID=UPI0028CA26AA|nr:alpha-amylase family glycosyl hydrolase [Rubrivirga sp. S365]MDT7855780.1 alpha-amylase family glycosyl hydrolase [Rubrivirga sp. S365]
MSHPWWQTRVVYQIYPRSFQDANGDGIGDLAGVTERLPYVAETLGIGAVWLSPFYPSPQADFGYDVSDYRDVDPQFGTLDDFDALAARCHELDLKLIVDFVPNHSSDQHAWFQESRAGRESAKRDWYVWSDPKPDGSPPNNWLSHFGGPAWTLDEATGQMYLHSFLHEQPDLNWRNPEVEAEMLDTLRFWMDRGVDGFRIDVAHSILKDPQMRDNPPRTAPPEGAFKSLGEYDTQLHVHDKAHADVHDAFARIRRTVDGHSDAERVAIGEIHEFDLDRWASFYGKPTGDGHLSGLHMPFNFGLLNVEWTAADVRAHVDAVEAALPDGAWPNYVLGNHDEPRLATRLGPESVRLAGLLLLTLRGTPTLYYGDELGMPDVDVPLDQRKDPWAERSGDPTLSRDGCRTPMAWDGSPSAGFSTAPPDALWLPLHASHDRVNVEAELADPDSHLAFYRRALAVRRETPALQTGAYSGLDGVPDGVFGFTRGDDALVLLHFGGGAVHVDLPARFRDGRVALSTDGRDGGGAAGASLALPAWGGVVVVR